MYMTLKGIRKQYNRAKNKEKVVQALSYINACTAEEIINIINNKEGNMPKKELSSMQCEIVEKLYLEGLTAMKISEETNIDYKAIRLYIKRKTTSGELPFRRDIGKEKEPIPTAIDTSSCEILHTEIITPNPTEVKQIIVPDIAREALLEKYEELSRERDLIATDLQDKDVQLIELKSFIEQVGGAV